MGHRSHDLESPLDLPPAAGPQRRPLGWTAVVLAVATAFLLLFNARALNGWAAEQPPSPLMLSVTDATEGWLAATERMELVAPRDALHALWKRAQALRFPGQPAAEP